MPSSPTDPAFPDGGSGSSKKKKLSKVLVENPNLDLENYIANYTGHAKIERLLFIADRCPPLQVDACKIALAELKKSTDVNKYQQVHERLNEALSHRRLPPVPLDTSWIESTLKAAREKTERLEAELKYLKSNTLKESTRLGCNELGDHHYRCGDLPKALKLYTSSRDYCTTAKHMVDMCLNVIKVSIELGNFTHVQSYVVKAESTADFADKSFVTAKLKCSNGLVNLVDSGKFSRAAKFFLETSFELGNSFSDIISPNDVAIYGGLCALASFDRGDLKSKVFDSDFKQYLELEPQIRELLYSFYNSKYATCLELLEKLKPDLLLDIYLHNHVDVIYQNIRKKALVQYFSPFLSVDMRKMAVAFKTTVAQLEPELASLITDGQIQARIDSHNKVLRVKRADKRTKIFETSFSLSNEYNSQTKHALLRMKLIRADMIVRAD